MLADESPDLPKAILAELGSDWVEHSHTFGFKSSNSVLGCCSKCKCTKHNMFDFASADAHESRTQADFEDAADKHMVTVKVSKAVAEQIAAKLEPDFRDKGSRGMSLTAPVLALRAWLT